MNKSQLKCLAVFSVFAIIGFGPISPGCLIGMYIIAKRPAWFLRLSNNVYAKQQFRDLEVQRKNVRKQCFYTLLGLFIIDILPVPVTPVISFYVILTRPNWFYRTVQLVYQE